MTTSRYNSLMDRTYTACTKAQAIEAAEELTSYLFPINGSRFVYTREGSKYVVVCTQGQMIGSARSEDFHAD